jgi:hypothetical protein
MSAPLPTPMRPQARSADQNRPDGRTNAICLTDISPRVLMEVLRQEYERNNLSAGRIEHLSNGHVRLAFYLKDGSRHEKPARKIDLAVAWMKEKRILDRERFFAGCPWANHSADLHSRAQRRLAKEGVIRKEGRMYVWVEEGEIPRKDH